MGILKIKEQKKKWYINNELHRVGGPAVVRPSGNHEWWIKGEKV